MSKNSPVAHLAGSLVCVGFCLFVFFPHGERRQKGTFIAGANFIARVNILFLLGTR